MSGFRKVGVCPFNCNAITVPDVPISENPDGAGADQDENESDDSDSADSSAECDLEETGTNVMDVDGDAAQTTTFNPFVPDPALKRGETGWLLRILKNSYFINNLAQLN